MNDNKTYSNKRKKEILETNNIQMLLNLTKKYDFKFRGNSISEIKKRIIEFEKQTCLYYE